MNQDILSIVSELLRIRSTADRPEELERVVNWVEDFFRDVPRVKTRRFLRNHKPSIVVSFVDGVTADIVLCGHLDVVPAEDTLFEPRIDGDRLYGRGTCDMKGSVAVMLHLMKSLAQEPVPPSVALMLTTDEEVGGADGVGYLVDHEAYRAKVVVVPDSGNALDQLILKSKGVAQIQMTSRGVQAHGARPWNGTNAIDRLLEAYDVIRRQLPDPKTYHEYSWEETYSANVIRAGSQHNVIPGTASMIFDFRLTETRDATRLMTDLQQLLPEMTFELLVDAPVISNDPKNPLLERYLKVATQVLSKPVQLLTEPGSHDGRFWAGHGIPCIVTRPLSGDQHGDNEWVSVSSLAQFYEILSRFVRAR